MVIANPSHWKYYHKDKGDKYDKIVEMIAELNTPTATPADHATEHETGGGDEVTPIDHASAHHTGGGDLLAHQSIPGSGSLSHSDLEAMLFLGSGNREYLATTFYTSSQPSQMPSQDSSSGDVLINSGTADAWWFFAIPLPVVRGPKKLWIDQMDFYLGDADDGDYLERVYLLGANGGSTTELEFDNRGGAFWKGGEIGTNPINFTAVDCSSYRSVFIAYLVRLTSVGDLDISPPRVRFYYA